MKRTPIKSLIKGVQAHEVTREQFRDLGNYYMNKAKGELGERIESYSCPGRRHIELNNVDHGTIIEIKPRYRHNGAGIDTPYLVQWDDGSTTWCNIASIFRAGNHACGIIRDELIYVKGSDPHRTAVERAFYAGLPVSPEVLADYSGIEKEIK